MMETRMRRGSGGLWDGHRVEDVATPEAWQSDPAFVWSFYSARRRAAQSAQPNAAHLALARIEQHLTQDSQSRFYLCTQNVDDLHERVKTVVVAENTKAGAVVSDLVTGIPDNRDVCFPRGAAQRANNAVLRVSRNRQFSTDSSDGFERSR